ncbi:MAG: hypothetical protein LBI64_06720 [Coriobacteriales bacterium]|jgi:hypothetical protein|nr:hypothetical protein [Coriobacteriales bacterium]
MSQRILKIYDLDLLKFTPGKDVNGDIACHIDKVYEENRDRLPLDLKLSDEGLAQWLRRRAIPKNRAYVQNLLAKMGLNIKETLGIIDICYGLSLNDSYWVTPSVFDKSFAQCNLFENNFDEFVAEVAFSGMGSFSGPTPRSSPEFTTGGMLAKAWRRRDDGIYLYKSGTTGFANAGKEPYSEYYAAQIAEVLGYRHTLYDLEVWKEMLCSTCKLWTDIDLSFIPIGWLVTAGGLSAVVDYYDKLGKSFMQEFTNMLIFDAIVANEDRHYGNFGLLIDSHTNHIISTAPIFDNGLSLLWSGLEDDLINWRDFLATRLPKAYDDYIGTARTYMDAEDVVRIKRLIGFEFQRHPQHNLPEERLTSLEQMVQGQVQKLLA